MDIFDEMIWVRFLCWMMLVKWLLGGRKEELYKMS